MLRVWASAVATGTARSRIREAAQSWLTRDATVQCNRNRSLPTLTNFSYGEMLLPLSPIAVGAACQNWRTTPAPMREKFSFSLGSVIPRKVTSGNEW